MSKLSESPPVTRESRILSEAYEKYNRTMKSSLASAVAPVAAVAPAAEAAPMLEDLLAKLAVATDNDERWNLAQAINGLS